VLAIVGALTPAAAWAKPQGGVAPLSANAPNVLTRAPVLEGELFAALNKVRVAHGLRPFRFSTNLRAAAARHSTEMGRLGFFSHASPGGGAFWRRIAWYYPARGYRDWSVGENLEYASPSLVAADVVRDWLRSPPHRANVLSSRWRDGGIGAVFVAPAPGIYGDLPTTIVTLDVGRRRR